MTVLRDGFEWQGRPYKSLSAIARAITGTRWNGLAILWPQKPAGWRMSKPIVRKLRCAIYTRKSSEEGLEQEFNSLDAQREACEAVHRQPEAGGLGRWPDHYDDGGVSGGTLDRPALKRLLADIEEGRVDVVVVYKIDRLSRALMDFAKLVEVFDRNSVTFVSVTQSFNTTTSMGRLHIPFKIRKHGGRKLILTPDGSAVGIEPRPRPRVDNAMIKALARGFRWRKLLETGIYGSIEDIAAKEKINSSYAGRLLRMTLLAPRIVEAILDGRQPTVMTLAALMKPLPLEWDRQLLLFGHPLTYGRP